MKQVKRGEKKKIVYAYNHSGILLSKDEWAMNVLILAIWVWIMIGSQNNRQTRSIIR